LILVTDHTNVTNDINAANDSWIIQPTNSTGVTTQSIYIELSPTADLVLSKLDAPANSISGQAIQVNWSVKNEGIVNPTNTWTDKIYLSTDFTIDSGDEIIGTKTQNREVAFGETYFDSLEVFIPIEAEGNYILIVKTDANNELFEVAGETNNQATQPITTELPLPADLVVSAISSADMMVVGQPFTINYTLENQGVNPAKGQFKDLIYLSKDSLLDATDLPITEPISRREDIVPLATVTHEVTATVPGVSTGSYYLLVDTDIQNNIHEIEEDNNLGMTPYKLEVTVPELIMNQSTSAILTDNTNIYYRIDIPQDLVNETMQVTLDALGDEGFNELYLRYGDIPSRATHDFSFSNAFSSDQAIVVPELVAGTYYVLVYGNNQVVAPPQEITLRAEIVPFQLTTVTQNKGGNSGPVTVKLEGSKFEPNMKVELKMGENTLSGFNLDYINSTEVYITFNLGAGDVINTWFREGIATGFYDVIIEKENGAITTLENGIEVIEGAPPSLKIDLVYPENVRVQRVVPMTINFTNNGYGNIPTPTYSVLSLRGAPIALSVAELKEEYQSVVFQLRETDGPADVLRPGASGSITIYAFSSQALTFKLVELN